MKKNMIWKIDQRTWWAYRQHVSSLRLKTKKKTTRHRRVSECANPENLPTESRNLTVSQLACYYWGRWSTMPWHFGWFHIEESGVVQSRSASWIRSKTVSGASFGSCKGQNVAIFSFPLRDSLFPNAWFFERDNGARYVAVFKEDRSRSSIFKEAKDMKKAHSITRKIELRTCGDCRWRGDGRKIRLIADLTRFFAVNTLVVLIMKLANRKFKILRFHN